MFKFKGGKFPSVFGTSKIKEVKKLIYIKNKYHTVITFHLNYLTVTLLNNSVELSSNLDKPVP